MFLQNLPNLRYFSIISEVLLPANKSHIFDLPHDLITRIVKIGLFFRGNVGFLQDLKDFVKGCLTSCLQALIMLLFAVGIYLGRKAKHPLTRVEDAG
jgi:hypothetical protein